MRPRLTCRDEGRGEPVVLLNGGMMTLSNWSETAQVLSSRWRVVRCDFRGQLLTPGPPFNAAMGEHAADLVELLDSLDIPRVHVVATSFGAEVGLLLAATHPERVGSLVATTATDWCTASMRAALSALRTTCDEAVAGTNRYAMFDLLAPMTYSRAYRDAHVGVLADRRAAVAALPNHWFEGTSSLLASLAELDLRPLLGRIACPTLVLRAEFDDIMPAERTRALARSIHGAEEELVNGSGHALVVEKPAEFLAAAVRFLDAHPLAGGGPRSRG